MTGLVVLLFRRSGEPTYSCVPLAGFDAARPPDGLTAAFLVPTAPERHRAVARVLEKLAGVGRDDAPVIQLYPPVDLTHARERAERLQKTEKPPVPRGPGSA